MKNLSWLLVVDALFVAIGLLLVLIRLLGFIFFAATNSWLFLIPSLVILMLIVTPKAAFDLLPSLLLLIVATYLLSLVFDGLERIVNFGISMEDIGELGVIAYFSFKRRRQISANPQSRPR